MDREAITWANLNKNKGCRCYRCFYLTSTEYCT